MFSNNKLTITKSPAAIVKLFREHIKTVVFNVPNVLNVLSVNKMASNWMVLFVAVVFMAVMTFAQNYEYEDEQKVRLQSKVTSILMTLLYDYNNNLVYGETCTSSKLPF